ncbi:MAG: NAD(P)-dependent alcohol dehydrogenase [Cytophagaceae bacterium]
MKAAISEKYGSPDVVRLREIEKPEPKNKEVLVKVYATTVNRTDCGLRAAHPFITRFFTGFFRPKNTILGSEFTGVIESIGKEVQTFKVGDKVFGISASTYGAHAEYLCINEDASIATLPKNLSLENAVAIGEGAWYAWNNLKEVSLKEGVTMLINGGSGSIGSAAIQLAKSFGVEVTAVTSTKNMELVKDLGASQVIDYTREDFTQLNRQFDYIFDAVGKTTFFKCRKLLKPNGTFFSTELGPYMQNPLLVLWTSVFGSKRVLFPIPEDKKENLLFFKNLAEIGLLKPVIDRVYPFDQVVEAYKYVESGQKTGSVVIKVV